MDGSPLPVTSVIALVTLKRNAPQKKYGRKKVKELLICPNKKKRGKIKAARKF